MISWNDLYTVLTAVIPLYVAMILAYGSVRWWKILSPDQCSGINRFVAIFAVPLLSFHFISTNNPYAMNFRFIAADTLQKIITLFGIGLWTNFAGKGSLDWMITLFSLSTLPNTLVMGIPLLIAMYGEHSGSLMVQIVVLQCIIWYTLLLFLLEYRGAKTLILEEFPETAASIVSFKVDAEVVSLDVRNFIDADAEIGDDGKLHVTVRKSNASKRSTGLGSIPVQTPRSSNLTGAEIFSLSSSSNTTPRGSNFNSTDCCSLLEVQGFSSGRQLSNSSPAELYSIQSSRGPTPRQSNFEENTGHRQTVISPCFGFYPAPNPDLCSNFPKIQKLLCEQCQLPYQQHSKDNHDDTKELHMFVWSSSSTSPVSDDDRLHVYGGTSFDATGEKSGRSEHCVKEIRMLVADHHHPLNGETKVVPESDDFPVENLDFERKEKKEKEASSNGLRMLGSTSRAETYRKATGKKMPPASVMIRLILIMVWRKLIRNLNTYSSLIGLTWSLIAFRWHMSMPKIIEKSISILSDAGLGMAMFSLGLFMGLQPKIIACGNTVAALAMAVRFLVGPAVMAAASVAVGLRGALLHIAIVQAALPQGIVPFVFAKEYNVHPEILSTAVIFGMLIALPITLVYYVVLGL